MKEFLTLATVTLLSTATAAYAGEAVDKQLGAIEAKPMATATPSIRLAALEARMQEHKATEFKETGVKPAAEPLAMSDAPKPEPKPEAPLAAMMASTQTLDTSKNLYEAIAKNDKAVTSKQMDVAAKNTGFMLASWDGEPGMAEPSGDYALDMAPVDPMTAEPEAFAKKDLSAPIASPFGVVSDSELAALDAAGVEPMGGPLDPAEFVSAGWTAQDADSDGALTPLEFAGWVASDADKADLAIAAEEQRDSAEPGTATVRLLNGTSLEFAAADMNGDIRVSAEELTAFIANA